jgi:hypothetical protein
LENVLSKNKEPHLKLQLMESANRKTGKTPQVYARTGGLLYLLMIILGIIQEMFIRGKIVVVGDAAATASNLRSMEMLWRLGIAFEMLMVILTVCLSLVLYVLTRPVNKNLALLAAFFGLLAIGVQAAYSLHLIEALFPAGNETYLNAFSAEQLNAMTTLSIKTHGSGFAVALLLFGPFFFTTGYLIYQSGYLPKFLGVLYVIAGLSYFISSFILILAPAFGAKYYFFIAGPALIGELSLSSWLLIRGVNSDRWSIMEASREKYHSIPES